MNKAETGRKARRGGTDMGTVLMLLVVVMALVGIGTQLDRIADALEEGACVQE